MIDFLSAALLIRDGLNPGLVYALPALSLILVVAVTRVWSLCQGELVAFAAFTLEVLKQDQMRGTAYRAFGVSPYARDTSLICSSDSSQCDQ